MRGRRAGAQQLSGSHLPGCRRRGAGSFLEPRTKPFEFSSLRQGNGLHGRQEHPVPLKAKGRPLALSSLHTHRQHQPSCQQRGGSARPSFHTGTGPRGGSTATKHPAPRQPSPRACSSALQAAPGCPHRRFCLVSWHRNQPSPWDRGCLPLQPVLRWKQAGTSTLQDAQTSRRPGSPTARGHPISQASAPRGPSSSSPDSRDEETPLQQPGRALPWQPPPLRAARAGLARLPAEPTPPARAGTAALTLGGCQPIREEPGVPVPSHRSVPSRCMGWQEQQQHGSKEGSAAGLTWPPARTEGRARPGFLPAQPTHGARDLKRPHGAGSHSVGARCSLPPPRACPCLSPLALRLFRL